MNGDIFPSRVEVDWISTETGNIVIITQKKFKPFEKRIASLLGAPTSVRRPLDEMNSKLWILMDGINSMEQIILEMDRTFEEKIAPVSERVSRSVAKFIELGLVTLQLEKSENVGE